MPTTPRGIWTPADTDDYDLVVDWAANANSIDTAIGNSEARVNTLRGTSAQRTATTAQYGQIWQDTNGSRYVWIGHTNGTWRRREGNTAVPSAAWTTTQSSGTVNIAGRTFTVTVPTTLDTGEALIVTAGSVGSSFGFISLLNAVNSAGGVDVTCRWGQLGSLATQSGSISWRIISV